MVILMDMDGVLVDFLTGFYDIHNKTFNIDTHTNYDVMEGLSKQEVKQAWHHIRKSRDFWYELPRLCTHDELEDIQELNYHHDVYFVTTREGVNVKEQTHGWLERNGLINPSVIISSRKGEIASAVNADFSLEDKAGNAVAIAYLARDCKSYIINRPWNKFGDCIGTKVRRIQTVRDFCDEVFKTK